MNNTLTKEKYIKAVEELIKIVNQPTGKELTPEELLKARKSQIPDGAIIISVKSIEKH